MAGIDRKRQQELEEDIRLLFLATDHQVDEAVGEEPGTVVRIAQPYEGFVRPRTLWEVWLEQPAPLDEALRALDVRRRRAGADRAFGIVVGEGLEEDSRPPSEGPATQAISSRRLIQELTGIADEVRYIASWSGEEMPGHADQFIPRNAVVERGQIVEAVEYVEDWLRQGHKEVLYVDGARGTGKKTFLEHLQYRSALAWMNNPGQTIPIVSAWSGWHDLPPRIIDPRLGIEAAVSNTRWSEGRPHSVARITKLPRAIVTVPSDADSHWTSELDDTIKLLPLEIDQVKQWYRGHLSSQQSALLMAAFAESEEFATFASMPAHLSLMLAAMRDSVKDGYRNALAWLAQSMAAFIEIIFSDLSYNTTQLDLLETGAFEEFALDAASPSLGMFTSPRYDRHDRLHVREIVFSWLTTDEDADFDHVRRGRGGIRARFSSQLVRDYFVARKIVSDVRAGRLEILTRHHFPEKYVLLYLAVLAPDVIARVSADRSEELRAQITAEAEQQVQLTLSHQLLRPIGALRMHVGRLRKKLPRELHDACESEFQRIIEELDHMNELADRTRLWLQEPESAREEISVSEMVDNVLAPLHDHAHEVAVEIDIAAGMSVMATRASLGSVLHYLLENAFQAAVMAMMGVRPRVTIAARYLGEGQTVRIDIRDNGPGVPEQDRERIFEPRVTTKKGGETNEGKRKPLGTGMGLPIARRYAEAMGGRVGLDAECEDTCFYVELIAARKES